MMYADNRDNRYDFWAVMEKHNLKVSPESIETLWVNVTHKCNQSCCHCHVDASPYRTEQMDRVVIDRCLEILQKHKEIKNLDITGGAPELNPHFDYFVTAARKLGKHIIVRHNLTIIFDGDPVTGAGKTYLPEFFAGFEVEVLASLPHYQQQETDIVRGQGVFWKTIEGIRLLNSIGYGKEETGLILNLVYNVSSPISQEERKRVEMKFKAELSKYGLVFNKLYAVTNMPVNRFRSQLELSCTYDSYMTALVRAFDPVAIKDIVCRSLVSVGYDGRLYDCDFNQMLGMQLVVDVPLSVFNFDFDKLIKRKIMFTSHCFGCTAGGGSN
jgi:radical SAM/Cys-rich protein